jgi:serine/threonine protein phosphatase PrpC
MSQSQMVGKSNSAVRKGNTPDNKPLEDYVFVDVEKRIYIVCDGVTRSLVNGEYPQRSPASRASETFARTAMGTLLNSISHLDPQNSLRLAVIEGNRAVKKLNDREFSNPDYLENDLAGTVSIIGIIYKGIFHYAYIGDVCGYLVDRKNAIRFTSPQTAKVAEYRKREGFTKGATLRIRRDFRNNKDSEYGYGVFTGEFSALDFVEYGRITLTPGQTLVLCSDGLVDLFDTYPQMLYEDSPERIFNEAERLERSLNIRSDDKALVIIQIS